MKKFITYIAIAIALLACSRGPEIDAPHGDSNIQISVSVAGGGSTTKGDVTQITNGSPGEGAYNENYLETLDFFFYLEGSADDDGVDYLGNDLPSAAAQYHIRKENVSANTTWALVDVADRDVLNAIFASGNRCIVYVIANYTPSTPFTGHEKRVDLRQMVATSDFNRVDSEGDGIPQTSFVMEGSTEIQRTEIAGLYYVSGTVPLYRSAAKTRLQVTIPESLYDAGDPNDYANHPDTRVRDGNGFIWIPKPEYMKAILVHGVKKGIVCAMDESYSYNFAGSDNYFAEASSNTLLDDYGHRMILTSENKDSNDEVVSKSYEHQVPMYSYPTLDWKSTPANETHMTLMLPWVRLKDDGTEEPSYTHTYYQIPIAINPTDPTYQLKHNRYYRMEVTVGILGSFELDDKVDLYPSTYIILDWSTMNDESTHSESNVNMAQTSYLAVATHRDTLNNVASHGVEYASSHDVTVTVTKIEYLNYKNKVVRMARITPDQPDRIYYYTQNSTTGEWDVPQQGQAYETSNGIYASYVADATTNEGYITLTHTITSSQYTPVNIYVNVSNGVVQDEEIIFTQYPPISIEGNLSEGNTFVNRVSNASTNNDIRTSTGEWVGAITEKSTAAGLDLTTNNTNPMLYSIKISSFSSSDHYVLGDPRVSSPDNNLGHTDASWSADITITFTKPSSGTYETQTGTYYYTYSQYQNRTGNQIKRQSNNKNSAYITLPSGDSWSNHTTEATAYGPDADNYYYWREYIDLGFYGGYWGDYYRARYYSTATRYVVTNERALENYYPTNPTGTADMIAPEILIASSYGKTGYSTAKAAVGDMTLELARMRCALYQESGYPAGRWRLPTYSEVEFIMGLSTGGTIPTLFQMSTPDDFEGYWCANGKVVLDNGTVKLETPGNYTDPGPTAPRCVYDLWYWGDEHEQYATTWHLGDND